MRVLLLSTYELGRQPFGLASPAAWLKAEGHEVHVADLSRDRMPMDEVRLADLVGFYLPMHTATRLALRAMEKVRDANPTARLACFGLYATTNEPYLRANGAEFVVGGEFESALAGLVRSLARGVPQDGSASTENGNSMPPGNGRDQAVPRLHFHVPDRTGLPVLQRYAQLHGRGAPVNAGYTEASRGCKHLCRHCPIVPVYNGVFRIVQRDVVLADIRQQVAAGAEHITFGDPDFFNGPGHAIPLVEALHAEFPWLTYDVTIKIEHLLKHRDLLPVLKRTGCLFVVSAVESLDDCVLEKLRKGHTRADFFETLNATREAGLAIAPTFVTFTPWTTVASFRELLDVLLEQDLTASVPPVQLGIRLLIPAGSLLLELDEIRAAILPFDAKSLCYPWVHADPEVDRLFARVQHTLRMHSGLARPLLFERIWRNTHDRPWPPDLHLTSRAIVPYLNEPWYC